MRGRACAGGNPHEATQYTCTLRLSRGCVCTCVDGDVIWTEPAAAGAVAPRTMEDHVARRSRARPRVVATGDLATRRLSRRARPCLERRGARAGACVGSEVDGRRDGRRQISSLYHDFASVTVSCVPVGVGSRCRVRCVRDLAFCQQHCIKPKSSRGEAER